jgi:hypothetical protein
MAEEARREVRYERNARATYDTYKSGAKSWTRFAESANVDPWGMEKEWPWR